MTPLVIVDHTNVVAAGVITSWFHSPAAAVSDAMLPGSVW